jgi:hypothetical protein
MKKVLLIASILFGWIGAYAQDFTPSDSYLYGVGISFSEESADSVAMLSLSRSIYTRVTSESERTVSEVDGKYSDSFVKRTGLSSSIGISGAKKDVSVNGDGQYVVYRYIDKEAYIAEHIDAYSKYMYEGSEYEGTALFDDDLKHRKNLVLGSYYKAYEALVDTTGILNILYGKEKIDFFKKKALERIETIYYNGWERIYVDHSDGRSSASGYRIVYPYSGQFVTEYLYGFEYLDNGVWKKPVAFYEKEDTNRNFGHKDDSIGDKNYTSAIIAYSPKVDAYGKYGFLEYRWLFEEKVGNMYVRLNVPEWMYKLKKDREIYINLNN